MEFDFDDDQYAFRDAVRSMLKKNFPAGSLREAWEKGFDYSDELWPLLTETGMAALTVPEQFGGIGGGHIDLTLPLEELGYFGVSEPIALTSGVVAPVIARCGTIDQKERWLSAIAEGAARGSVMVGDDRYVVDAQAAEVFVVEHGAVLHLVPRDAANVRPISTQDPSLRLGLCDFELDESTFMSGEVADIEFAQAAARATAASLLVGNSQRLLDMTRDYLLVREQFGRLIGSFQAVKHRMADAMVRLEAARSLGWYAHYCLERDADQATIAASMAKDSANDAARLANYASLQLHGGIGFTWEYDLHLWLQRGKALETLFGTETELTVLLGDQYLKAVNER